MMLATAATSSAASARRPAPAERAMVALDGVTQRFGDRTALDDVSLQVERGEIVCLLGPSGSGKSTLLRLVAGIDWLSRGRIHLDGVEVAGPGVFVEPELRRVGMVFQDYALFPHLTVAENVAFGLRGRPREEARRTVGELLERLGVLRYAHSYPHTVSGGERQRVALARALAPRPRVLLMDEPFSSLDGPLRDRVRQETVALLRELHTTTILVTHDPSEAVRTADRVALLRAGKLLQCGSAEELYLRPATMAAARLFGDINELGGICRGGRVETRLGAFAAPGVADGAAARVCIRPQHVRLVPGGGAVTATVVGCEFQGNTGHQVTLAVADLGVPLLAQVAGQVEVRPGDCVGLDVCRSEVIVVADDAEA